MVDCTGSEQPYCSVRVDTFRHLCVHVCVESVDMCVCVCVSVGV
jgi:hypothetical protein